MAVADERIGTILSMSTEITVTQLCKTQRSHISPRDKIYTCFKIGQDVPIFTARLLSWPSCQASQLPRRNRQGGGGTLIILHSP